jgi:YD repeat-containing protein
LSTSDWPAGTTFRYEWIADGRVVGRARTLDLTPEHYGHLLVARLRASQPGHEDRVMDVDTNGVVAAPAPRVVKVPTLAGAQRPGSTITVSPGRWNVPGVRFAYSWRSGNITSSDNRSARYRLDLPDVGHVVRVHVVVSAPGYESTSFDLATRTIPRLTPTMRATLARTTVSTSSRGRVTVAVKGQVGATGTVTVRYGSRTVSTAMKASSKNKVTLVLPRLKKGSYKVTATYVPTGRSAKVLTSKKVSAGTLRVR